MVYQWIIWVCTSCGVFIGKFCWTLALLYENIQLLRISDYRQVSNISRTLVGNKIVDHSDVVGASPVGAAPTTSSFST